jgi:hypothetical protein
MAKSMPRFRKELPASATETDGVPCVLVTDPATGTSFTFYEFEYDLAHQLDGKQDTDEIMAWSVANYQTALTAEAIEEFAAKLRELGFLDESAGDDGAEAEWNAGVTTDQFKPDAALLAGGAPADMSGANVLSADALTEIAESGPVQDAVAAATASASAVPRPIGPMSSGGFSRSFGERRQPPGPDNVVMTPFEDVSMRFRAPPPERQRSSTGLVVGFLALAVAGGGGGYYYWMTQHPKAPEALRIRVVSPQPTAVYRWFAAPGTVVDLDARTLSFDTAGKIAELSPTGTKFAAGDVLGKLQGAADVEAELAKNKSKLAVSEQLRDSIKAGNGKKKGDLRDAEDKVAARKKLVDEAQANLAKLVLKAPEPGAIIETSGKVGALVSAKMTVLKWRGRSLHGDFTMDQEDFVKASKLEFCRVEVSGLGTTTGTPGAQSAGTTPPAGSTAARSDAGAAAAAPSGEGRFVDCMFPPPAPPPPNGIPSLLRKFIVTLPTDAGLVTGQQLHLARKRYDGVFPLPVSAVQPITDVEAKIWVALPNRTAEQRSVTVAESRDEVLVAAGINVGDEIIVEPPRDLAPGTLLEPIR